MPPRGGCDPGAICLPLLISQHGVGGEGGDDWLPDGAHVIGTWARRCRAGEHGIAPASRRARTAGALRWYGPSDADPRGRRSAAYPRGSWPDGARHAGAEDQGAGRPQLHQPDGVREEAGPRAVASAARNGRERARLRARRTSGGSAASGDRKRHGTHEPESPRERCALKISRPGRLRLKSIRPKYSRQDPQDAAYWVSDEKGSSQCLPGSRQKQIRARRCGRSGVQPIPRAPIGAPLETRIAVLPQPRSRTKEEDAHNRATSHIEERCPSHFTNDKEKVAHA